MAEQIPFNIIADVLTKLGSLAIQEIGSACGVAKELTALKPKLDAINGVLVDAEEKQVESHAVQAWLRRLKNVVYDADELLDDFATRQLQRGGVASKVSDFFSSSNQVAFRFKMSNKVKYIKKEVDEIVKEIPPMLNLIQGNIVHRWEESGWRETHSFVLTSEMVERDEDKEEIIKLLVTSGNEKNLSAVAIIGIGGLGKTTLAQLVYNDKRVAEFFEAKIWICVSNDFNVKVVVKKILESLCGGVAGNLESLEVLKDSLHETLSQTRYLLVLDDVWNDDFKKWDELRTLLMVGAKGSKILVTTRNSNVASTMGLDHFPFSLNGLKESQAWGLFSKIAFTEELEKVHSKFIEIGKEIVNMCNGVPLVIKTLGTILRLKTEESHWLTIKNNKNLLSLGAGNDNVLSVLKLSYDDLPVYLKQCFAYCALFPKNYKIEKSMLVQLWMAQGYIQPLDENVGHQYFEELLSRSLLEEFEKDDSNNILSFKMHDLIHDLAQSVIGTEVLILEDDVKEISKEVRHVSLFRLKNKLEALKVKHMRTFLCIHANTRYPFDSIRSTTCSSFMHLRALSLNNSDVYKVPKSLGKLSHLRYLDLSYNAFEALPDSITRLKNLQTLKLVGCHNFKKFPKDIRELINLRHLENDECRVLNHMPCGMGELTSLRSLPVFVVGNWRGVGRLSELKRLNNLQGRLWIARLERVRDAALESREANLGEKQHIQSLRLSWPRSGAQSAEDAESVLEGLQPHPNLKKLCIEGYRGIRFPSWMMNGGLSSVLPNLTTVDLKGCSSCQTLPCFVRLRHLKSLQLHYLDKVEYMEYCSSEEPFFPSLQKLSLHTMLNLKELWRRELPTHPPPSFPCLSQLEIQLCSQLASLELSPCPLLSKFLISQYHNLTSLILPPSPLLSELEIRYCDKLTSLELHSSPLLSVFLITGCHKLTSLLLPPFPLLSVFLITKCHKLTSLLLPSSPLLSQLEIRNCFELASLELHSSPRLSKLHILECPKLTSLLLPPSPHLSQLDVVSCKELASLILHSSPLLSSLRILDCPKLISLLLPPSSFLSGLRIFRCPKLTSLQMSSLRCLKTLELDEVREEVLRQLMLSATASPLESVFICNIDELTSLPDELHQHVSTLQTLKIWDCSRLATLPHWIGDLTSLTDLHIGSCHQLPSLPEEFRSLRVLKHLKIHNWSGLTTLPDWIGSLPSLEYLEISECPNLTSLPEKMGSLTTLRILEISTCPHLFRRYQRENGEGWPKIAHAQRIYS